MRAASTASLLVRRADRSAGLSEDARSIDQLELRMTETVFFTPGGYRYLPFRFQ